MAGRAELARAPDGRYVAFESSATNLVAGDSNGVKDVFLRDTLLDVTSRMSVATSGGQADRQSVDPAMGRQIFSRCLNITTKDELEICLKVCVLSGEHGITV